MNAPMEHHLTSHDDPDVPSLQPNQGQFVLTFDLELGWGSIENGAWQQFESKGYFRETRPALKTILQALDDFEIPATWGVVGALFTPAEQRDFSHLPVTMRDRILHVADQASAETLDGRDMIDQIAAARTEHRFCCHTFSHVRFSHPDMDAITVRRDLQQFADCRPSTWNYSPSLIFPCNHVGFLSTVRDCGFVTCRGPATAGGPAARTRRQKVADLFNLPPASVVAEPVPGLRQETDSLLFNSGRRAWKRPLVIRRALRGLRMRTSRQQVYHVWSHPFDFAGDARLVDGFIRLLRTAADLRERGQLSIRLF